MNLRPLVLMLTVLCGTHLSAFAQPPGSRGDASSPPGGSSLGLHVGILLPSDRAGIGIDGGGADRIDDYLRATPERVASIESALGGPFSVAGEPADFTFDPVVTFGVALGYEIRPGWAAQIGVASYRGKAGASFPLHVETDAGPRTMTGQLSTDVRGLLVDVLVRRHWNLGAYMPQIGAGVRLHRISPEDTWFEFGPLGVLVEPADARTNLSPMGEIGLARAIGGKIRVGVAGVIAGRSLPSEAGAKSWVVEPEFRLWGSLLLASKGPAPPPPPKEHGASEEGGEGAGEPHRP